MNTTMAELFAAPIKPFNSWPDKKLAAESKQVALSMTGNAAFPNPEPSMPIFSAGVDAFIDQLGKAGSRDATAIAAKNTKRFELVQLCNSLVNSVASTANGNREMLVSTGLPLRKLPQPVVLRNPENFTVTNGINPGDLKLKIKANKAKSNIFEYTEDPPTETSVWTRFTCTSSSYTVSGLQPGKRYWFRVASVGGRNQLAWGETILSPYVQ
ncbi:MAG: fibronectin type III domain-containing protein [Ginsengibacter sp.]